MLTKECKEDIISYLHKKGWGRKLSVFTSSRNEINRTYFLDSKKGREKKLRTNHFKNGQWGSFDKYLLNYLSPVLLKHNIKIITINDNYIYKSTDWKFKNIKLTNHT